MRATEMLALLGLREVVVFGWSLGGHIALEMASQFAGIKGLINQWGSTRKPAQHRRRLHPNTALEAGRTAGSWSI
jgi:pimeloyl-ACP methyl ester carboxylesterase